MMSIVIMAGSIVGCGKNAENTAVMNEMPEHITTTDASTNCAVVQSESKEAYPEAYSGFDKGVLNIESAMVAGDQWQGQSMDWNTEEYSAISEAGYEAVANEPLSTFSADVREDEEEFAYLVKRLEKNS